MITMAYAAAGHQQPKGSQLKDVASLLLMMKPASESSGFHAPAKPRSRNKQAALLTSTQDRNVRAAMAAPKYTKEQEYFMKYLSTPPVLLTVWMSLTAAG